VVADGLAVALDRLEEELAQVGEAPHEARRELGQEAKHVVQHEDLPVAALARADADGGDGEGLGELVREDLGDALQDDGVGPRVLEGLGVEQELGARLVGAALDLVPAELVDGLGGEARCGP
jgi:hypothetical protein